MQRERRPSRKLQSVYGIRELMTISQGKLVEALAISTIDEIEAIERGDVCGDNVVVASPKRITPSVPNTLQLLGHLGDCLVELRAEAGVFTAPKPLIIVAGARFLRGDRDIGFVM